MKNNLWVGYACLFTATVLWGGMYVVSKYVLAQVPVFTVLWLRYLIAFLCLFFICFRQKKHIIQRKDFPIIIWLSFLGYFLANTTGFYGTHFTTSSMSALLISLSPVFTMILASILLREKISYKKILAMGICTAGAIIVLGFEQNKGENHLLGIIILLLSALSWAGFSVYVKKAALKYSTITITTYSTLLALLMTTPFMLKELDEQILLNLLKPDIWISILYLAIFATAVAFYLWNKGLEYVEASIGSLVYFFAPVVSGILGWAMLNEQLNWNFFLGGLLIIFGAGYIAIPKRKTKESLNNSEYLNY